MIIVLLGLSIMMVVSYITGVSEVMTIAMSMDW